MKTLIYLLIGTVFGITMYKSEAASWFRIHEMFRFESFHMYGIIGVAVSVGMLSVYLIKQFQLKSIEKEEIQFQEKEKSIWRYLIGGSLFGLGWALAGACPGPMFVMVGSGYYSMLIVIGAALLGTFTYGLIKEKLPH